LIVVFALIIVYWALAVVGVLDSIAHLLSTAGFGSPKTGFKFHAFWIFSRLLLMGVLGVLLWAFVDPFLAVLYNLVTEVVGGVQVPLQEKRLARPSIDTFERTRVGSSPRATAPARLGPRACSSGG